MTSVLKAIALLLIGGLMVCAFVFFAVWGIALLLFVFAIFGVAWAGNVRFKVTSEGKHIGWYTRKGGFVSK